MKVVMEQLIGNPEAKQYILQMAKRGTIGNSLLFAGPDGVGKSLFARSLAALVLGDAQRDRINHGNHPDVREFRTEGKVGLHSIDSLRQLSSEVYMAPYESHKKVFIIHDADRMLPTSANALLKTFEEPPEDTIIILLTSAPERLLPTILSRCKRIAFKPIPQEELKSWIQLHHSDQNAELISMLAKGSLARALALVEEGESSLRKDMLNLLAKGAFPHYQALKDQAEAIGKEFESKRKDLEEAARNELVKNDPKDLNAVQKQALEKEISGASSLRIMNEIDHLLDLFLSWFRDLHLVQTGGPIQLLMNPDFYSPLFQRVQQGNLPDIEEIQKAVSETRLAIQRFSPINSSFEVLFIKLKLI